jgi:hypothetical protein
MAADRHVADPRLALAEARVKRDAPPARSVCVDERIDGGLKPGFLDGGDKDAALPGGVGRGGDMLREAAAAGEEIGAERLDAVGRRLLQLDETSPRTVPLDRDCLARKRVRHVYRVPFDMGDAVGAGAEALDPDPLSHVAPRSGTRGCPRRRGWGWG